MNGTTISVHKQSAKYQYLAGFVVNLIMINNGVMVGWNSPCILVLSSEKSPLPSGKLTRSETDWISSALPLGAAVGNFLCGFINKRYGRKNPLIAMGIISIISWLLVYFAQNFTYLYAARLIHGFVVGGVIVITPVYLIEIADDRNRGRIGLVVSFSGNLGVLLAFMIGAYGDFYIFPPFAIFLTLAFTICFVFFPESPAFLAKQNKFSECEKSIRFFRNIQETNSRIVELELEKLQHAIGRSKTNGNRLSCSDFITNPGRKAIIIGIALASLNQFSGITAVLCYTANILKAAGSSFNENTSAMIVAGIQLIGTIAVTPLVDRAGRKLLYIFSTIGTAIGYIILGFYIESLSITYKWISIASVSFILFLASFAITSIPLTVIAEVMPEDLKEFGVAFCVTVLSICSFIVLQFFRAICDSIGYDGCMFIFAGVCLSGTVFVILFLPETNGRSYDEIMDMLK